MPKFFQQRVIPSSYECDWFWAFPFLDEDGRIQDAWDIAYKSDFVCPVCSKITRQLRLAVQEPKAGSALTGKQVILGIVHEHESCLKRFPPDLWAI